METSATRGPKWIRKLIRESWQAELIISGAAIIGSLQLPGLLEWFQHKLLVSYDQGILNLWFLAAVYWAAFVYGLIILFIFHFVVRALWIGLLGLKSKYPEGIARTTLTSKDFQDKTIAEYGGIDTFISRLDKTASGLFGTGFTFAGLFLNIGVLLSVAIFVFAFLQGWGLPSVITYVVIITPLVLLVLMSVVSTLMSTEGFRHRPWVKRYHFPVTRLMNRLITPINHKFTSMGMNLITSNAAAAKFKDRKATTSDIIFSFLILTGVGVLIGAASALSDVMKPQFLRGHYWGMGNDTTGMDPGNYADSDYTGLLYEPQISARYVEAGEPFWVWVPLPERELQPLLDHCTITEVNDDDLTFSEARRARRERVLVCARQYIELHLDSLPQALPLPGPLRHERTTAGVEQLGIYLDLSDQIPAEGRHDLTVVTHFERRPGDGRYRRTHIPFFVVTGND